MLTSSIVSYCTVSDGLITGLSRVLIVNTEDWRRVVMYLRVLHSLILSLLPHEIKTIKSIVVSWFL